MSLRTLSATLGTTAVMACVASPALAQIADWTPCTWYEVACGAPAYDRGTTHSCLT